MENKNPFFIEVSDLTENLISNIQGGVIICRYDPACGQSKIVYMSEGWTKLTGYNLEQLESEFGGNPQALVIEEDQAQAGKSYVEQMKNSNCYQLEYRFRHRDGHIVWAIDRGIITATADGFNQNQSIITDITPIKENEEKLKTSEARLRMATKASHGAIFEYDIEANRYLHLENAEVVFRSDSQSVMEALEQAKIRKENFTLADALAVWYHPEDIPLILACYEDMKENVSSEYEVRLRQPNGSYIWCRSNQVLIADAEGEPVRIVGYILNVDEQHKKTEKLRQEAQSDALTRLLNKSAMKDMIENTLMDGPKMPHALLILDIDNFKGVNDKLGHLFGDAVLMDVSAKLSRLFRRDGIVGRIGGDEFAVLIPGNMTAQGAAERAEEICTAFRHTYSGEKADYKISCSVGVTLAEDGDTYSSLFRKADIALYRAKAQGKDQYIVYSDGQSDIPAKAIVHQTDDADSGKLKIKERIFELLYGSVDFTGSVNMILALLGQLLDVSRVYIFENYSDGMFAQNIYEWCATGVEPLMASMQRFPVGETKFFDKFDSRGICRCMDVASLPGDMRKEYEERGAISSFQVAIEEEGVVRGFMGYESVHKTMGQSSEDIDLMTFAAKVTGTFIIKKRADESVKLYNQNKMEALDKLPSAIYVIDEDYRLHYMNNLVISTIPETRLGQKCHEAFMKTPQPCSDCPAAHCTSQPCSQEIYNPITDIWMLTTASYVNWSGRDNMRLLNCQVVNQYKKNQ